MGDVDDLRKEFQKLAANFAQVQSQNDALSKTVNDMRSQNNALSQTVDDMQQRERSLNDTITRLNDANKDLNASLADLSSKQAKPEASQQLTPAAIAEIVKQVMTASNNGGDGGDKPRAHSSRGPNVNLPRFDGSIYSCFERWQRELEMHFRYLEWQDNDPRRVL